MATLSTEAKACLDACCTVVRTCLEAAAMCADTGRIPQCKALHDCIAVCDATATCIANASECCPSMCEVCAEFCAQCVKVCRAVNDPKLSACIEACRACANCCEAFCQTGGQHASKA